MSPYVFVAAVLLAIIPILIIFKVSVERIKEDPAQRGKAQVHFLIGAALSEVIPIILIVYGLTNIAPVETIQELYTPGIIIILTIVIAAFFIFLQRTFDVEESHKEAVNTFAMTSMAITNAVPIVAIIALVNMIP